MNSKRMYRHTKLTPAEIYDGGIGSHAAGLYGVTRKTTDVMVLSGRLREMARLLRARCTRPRSRNYRRSSGNGTILPVRVNDSARRLPDVGVNDKLLASLARFSLLWH